MQRSLRCKSKRGTGNLKIPSSFHPRVCDRDQSSVSSLKSGKGLGEGISSPVGSICAYMASRQSQVASFFPAVFPDTCPRRLLSGKKRRGQASGKKCRGQASGKKCRGQVYRGFKFQVPFSLLCVTLLPLLLSCAYSQGMKGEETSGPLPSVINFYRGPLNRLSAVRHGACPMYPSCSEYSRQCIQKHGMIIGWMMTCDRLMRCGRDETQSAPEIRVNGKWKYDDAVERNDFWWEKRVGK